MKLLARTILFLVVSANLLHAARVKDLVVVDGGRDNQLVGYGLVIGLAGDGDSDSPMTINAVSNSLRRFGLTVNADDLKSKNVAAVMITADIPPFAREGTRIDVTVSSIGDAESLQGGVLLQTPLLGADEAVYAVAQGQIAVGGYLGGNGGAGGATVQKNHPTVGQIANGAIVEREIDMEVGKGGHVKLLLRNPDYNTSSKLAEGINVIFPSSTIAVDAAAVQVTIPEMYLGREVDFISSIGGITIEPDTPARIIINERTGTIVATAGVRVSTVAVSHGSLSLTIARSQNVSQPGALAQAGETAVTEGTELTVTEELGAFHMIPDYPTIQQVTNALNAMGVSTREMMSILQAMKSAGALQAELIIK
ncbi:flagellar basal body P-ring protein FlgI [Pelagicoccus sp. SDUM812002]|uniref:flagellar basal body P-ring protein FlgI n=1 Tax=Pelagicoccus sp. SDUM812002 TaxID=3041266 RepID=UPI00280EEF8F|nr:flagellar basal body P-ring protein FlgI [Pelagicoccus sp. SDUM812002]MDQ8185967.1 flagellar basal body P-ring protein FlgI [Pelagicoccus sp. SDUM812002]